MKTKFGIRIVMFALIVVSVACSRNSGKLQSGQTAAARQTAPPSQTLAQGHQETMMAVNFLENRIKEDPDDIVALNKLSSYYLQLHRETDDVGYLEHALRCAQSSMKVLPADQNLGGLRALAVAEYETHNFVDAREHAHELTEYEPRRSLGFQLLGDASLELGNYDEAGKAYQKMEELDAGSVATETRLAHLLMLSGNSVTAHRKYLNALDQAKATSPASAETIAWCYWQLGEVARTSNQKNAALHFYRGALDAFPEYPHAVASLAQLRASQGDLDAAIASFEKITTKRADPVDVAILGDLYELAGRKDKASEQHQKVEQLCQQNQLYSRLYNRHLVLFWADHDLNVERAYTLAKDEYQTRRDIYAADALAWAAMKAGKLDEAQEAIKNAMRLGTEDARIFYHAGMIARAKGDGVSAAAFLTRALQVNPDFDPLQAKVAVQALASVR
jgi:tetratricopeptide (TPR) repeat protein